MTKEFTTAAAAADEQDDTLIEFTVDGTDLQAYRPTDGQLALVMTSLGQRASVIDRASGVIDFFMGLFEQDEQRYFADRLMDRHDSFGLEQITEILEWMIEEWSGRPTQPPSASTPSRPNGGRRSTASARRTASIPSGSGQTVSAT